jgi:hypothetical protein
MDQKKFGKVLLVSAGVLTVLIFLTAESLYVGVGFWALIELSTYIRYDSYFNGGLQCSLMLKHILIMPLFIMGFGWAAFWELLPKNWFNQYNYEK